jgi:hypothetical protein
LYIYDLSVPLFKPRPPPRWNIAPLSLTNCQNHQSLLNLKPERVFVLGRKKQLIYLQQEFSAKKKINVKKKDPFSSKKETMLIF